MGDEEGLQQGNYCMGWMSGFYRDGHVIQHGGTTVGFATECAFMPAHKTGARVFTTYGTIDMTLTHRHDDVFDTKMPDFFRGFKMGPIFQCAPDGNIRNVAPSLAFDPLLEEG